MTLSLIPDDGPGQGSLQSSWPRSRPEGDNHQTDPATNSHLHCDPVEGQGSRV